MLLLGIGNACFHVGGGRAAMELKENACQPVGIFVATGAFGVFGGKWISGNGRNWIVPMIVVLSMALLIQLIFCRYSGERNLPKQEFSMKPMQGSWSLLMAILLYLCCCASFFCRKCDAFSMGEKLVCTVPNACNCIGKGGRWNSC